jgi:hypothetical protein
MRLVDLVQEIDIELEALQTTVSELEALRRDLAGHEPTTRELAATALFLANFYNGIENVLKRICRFHNVDVPAGSDWHLELAKSFSNPPRPGFPSLLDEQLASDLAPYRQFRHVVHHGYGFRIRWVDMQPGLATTASIVARFRHIVDCYLASLPDDPHSLTQAI